MPCHSTRKHTPIVSEKQQGLFGAEYARRKKGLKGRMLGITVSELKSHLKESKGKKFHKSCVPKLNTIEKYHDGEIEKR